MTNSKKKRMSMLDSLAATGTPAPPSPTSMMSSNRALRSARDAVDAHNVWELDPDSIEDDRLADRLDPGDVLDLRDAIEANGQTVPILVRRHPQNADQYLLVYGRRRLEAIRSSDKVNKVRALVANLDEDHAVRAQISENMARRDLSFIEKALFAQELVASGFGNQSQVAEVLTVTKSAISMALAIVEMVGTDLVRAIGAAHGVGRPKWEALGKEIEAQAIDRTELIRIAEDIHVKASVELVTENTPRDPAQISLDAFTAVEAALAQSATKPKNPNLKTAAKSRMLKVAGQKSGAVKRTPKGVSITLDNSHFADWVEAEAQDLIEELYARWKSRAED